MEPALQQEIEKIGRQETTLVFSKFDSEDALSIGREIVAVAERDELPIEVDIEMEGHCLFHCALRGATAENTDWIRRKQRMIQEAQSSSLMAFLQLEKAGKTFSEQYPDVSEEVCCASGGGFPIRIGQEIKGHIIVSGLPHTEDHALVVSAIERHLEQEKTPR